MHLDLKPDNVLLGSLDPTNPKCRTLYLIDFGITRKYKEADGSHIPFKVDVPFTGNIVFSSVNSFLNYGKASLFVMGRAEQKGRHGVVNVPLNVSRSRKPPMDLHAVCQEPERVSTPD